MEILLTSTFLVILLTLFVKFFLLIITKYLDKNWGIRLREPIITYWFLIGWTLLGFFTKLDYIEYWGCVRFEEDVFSAQNILYSGTTMLVYIAVWFIQSKQFGRVLLMGELLCWLYKLYFVKGGYVVGFGGIPMIEVVIFDTIALLLRLLMLKYQLHINIHNVFVFILAVIMMTLKIIFFKAILL